MGLLSGSSISDIVSALTSFCQMYGSDGWAALLRQELPDLTDEDIKWLSDLSEEMEQFEPKTLVTVMMDTLDTDVQDLAGTARSKRGRRRARIADRDARAQPQETAALPAAAPRPSTPPRVARSKRKAHSPSHPICTSRSTRQYNTRPSTSDAALVNTEDWAA